MSQKKTTCTFSVDERLVRSKLYIILDCMSNEETFQKHVETLLTVPVDCIQLRDKTATDQMLVSRAKLLRRLTEEAEADSRPLFIVNDRADIAVLVKADGVHVGQDELTVSQVRHMVGNTMLVGVSTHSIAEARAAVSSGADYIGAGPTFPSSTKHFDDFPGLDYLQKVVADTTITVPTFAIGGITLQNTPEVLATGITRVAVSSARCDAAEFRKML